MQLCVPDAPHDKSENNLLRPHLNGFTGRKAGSAEGYSNQPLSKALAWDEATLDEFMTNPDPVMHDNNMKTYTGAFTMLPRARLSWSF